MSNRQASSLTGGNRSRPAGSNPETTTRNNLKASLGPLKMAYKEQRQALEQQTSLGMHVMSACGGIGTLPLALKELGINVSKLTGIEWDGVSNDISRTHHAQDHSSLPQDLHQIQERHIDDYVAQHGCPDIFLWSTPCQGLSRANKAGKGLADHRSCLFLQGLRILQWLRKHKADIWYIAENVDFRESHPMDYRRICDELSVPTHNHHHNAKSLSAASRSRLFWHNLPEPSTTPQAVDANTCLAPGARLPRGATTMPCIMASWRCRHPSCRRAGECTSPHNHTPYQQMHTGNPVLVEHHGTLRHISASEAEAAMGMPPGYTSIATREDGEQYIISDLHRLQRIGMAIDVRQLKYLLSGLRTDTSRNRPSQEIRAGQQSDWNVGNIVEWLTPGPMPDRVPLQKGWQPHGRLHQAADLVRDMVIGFPLRFQGDRDESVDADNGHSYEHNPQEAAAGVASELAKGNLAGPFTEPPLKGFRVTPRSLKDEGEKFRHITMGNQPLGNCVNDGIPKAEMIQLARGQDIDRRIRQCYQQTGQVWMAKADIKSAYRTMPVRPSDWHLQGLKQGGKYYIDKKMSFGCRSAVDQWLRFANALAWAMARQGIHVEWYVDDFIFIAGSESECRRHKRAFQAMCADWGVILKEQPDSDPSQQLVVLGIHYDLLTMTKKITKGRTEELLEHLQLATTARQRGHWERLTGILWYVVRCVPMATPHLQPIMETTIRARRTRSRAKPSRAAMQSLDWWSSTLRLIHDGHGASWHGEALLPRSLTSVTVASGDAGSEWGMGAIDDRHYYSQKWPAHMWDAVQRTKSTSSLHMEALQLLVAARVLGPTWAGQDVNMRLDSLGLVQTLRKGRHQHEPINDILRELTHLQVHHGFVLHASWIRRTYNEAADALSKDDMPRFWANTTGDRTRIYPTPADLTPPMSEAALDSMGAERRCPANTAADRSQKASAAPCANQIVGSGRRHSAAQAWQPRPPKQDPHILGNSTRLLSRLTHQVNQTQALHNPLAQHRSAIRHYLRFCRRAGIDTNVAPDLPTMHKHTLLWLQDAPQSYRHDGATKKALTTGTIRTYLSGIDAWYSHTAGQPRGCLTRDPGVREHVKVITADFCSGNNQVHGISYEGLVSIIGRCRKLSPATGSLLEAAFTLAWFALLRPSEYMLTPRHPRFDPSRHLRAGDITFYKEGLLTQPGVGPTPDAMKANIKQSKTDCLRLGADLSIGRTYRDVCPVMACWNFFSANRVDSHGPAFCTTGPIRYHTMLNALRHCIHREPNLYGLHSFRVGGAQAMALAGAPIMTIMAHGRWKTMESVARYVENPEHIASQMSALMATTAAERRLGNPDRVSGRVHAQPERDTVLLSHGPSWAHQQ